VEVVGISLGKRAFAGAHCGFDRAGQRLAGPAPSDSFYQGSQHVERLGIATRTELQGGEGELRDGHRRAGPDGGGATDGVVYLRYRRPVGAIHTVGSLDGR
jgi:hypothetical protein